METQTEQKEWNPWRRYIDEYCDMWHRSCGYTNNCEAFIDAAAMAYYGMADINATGRNSHWGWLAR